MADDPGSLVRGDAAVVGKACPVALADDPRQFLRRQVLDDTRGDAVVLQAAPLEQVLQQRLVVRSVTGLGDENPDGGRQRGGEPLGHPFAQLEAPVPQLGEPGVHLPMSGLEFLALADQAFELVTRLS